MGAYLACRLLGRAIGVHPYLRKVVAEARFHILLQRCVERPDRHLLLVHWETLEAHTVGFRGSPDYARWKSLLHHFYDPFPTVKRYTLLQAYER